jgi:FkbM family methyltransferase
MKRVNIIGAIKSRLGGSLYDSLRMFKGVRKPSDSPGRMVYGYKYALVKHILLRPFGNHLLRYFDDFYASFTERGSGGEGFEVLNFNGIRIPKPLNDADKYMFFYDIIEHFVYFVTDNHDFFDSINTYGPYELGRVRVGENDTVIDCGANVGMFSAAAAHRTNVRGGGGTVYAFEPSPNVIERYLSKTAALYDNIKIAPYALSDRAGEASFMENTEQILSSHLAHIDRDRGGVPITVNVTTPDDFVRENGIPRVDFIKADIEGAEREMLRGAREVLREFAPKLAICAYHLPDDPEVLRGLILQANPKYVVEEKFRKIYAYVPE